MTHTGQILYYRDNPALRDKIFYNPHWVSHEVVGNALSPALQYGLPHDKGIVTPESLKTFAAARNMAPEDLQNLLCQMGLAFKMGEVQGGVVLSLIFSSASFLFCVSQTTRPLVAVMRTLCPPSPPRLR